MQDGGAAGGEEGCGQEGHGGEEFLGVGHFCFWERWSGDFGDGGGGEGPSGSVECRRKVVVLGYAES